MLQHLARLELHLANARLSVLPRAFVEHAVDVLQTLGERHPIVRVNLDDTIAGNWSGRFLLLCHG